MTTDAAGFDIDQNNLDRDNALEAIVLQAGTDGWRAACRSPEAAIYFPGGVETVLAAFHEALDGAMIALAGDLDGMRLTQKVRTLVLARLEAATPYKAALRRALPLGFNPRLGGLLAGLLAKTVDQIWRSAGDRSADANWYSKRAILAAVYGSTMLFWLRDKTDDIDATTGFLDNRLENVKQIGQGKQRIKSLTATFWGCAA